MLTGCAERVGTLLPWSRLKPMLADYVWHGAVSYTFTLITHLFDLVVFAQVYTYLIFVVYRPCHWARPRSDTNDASAALFCARLAGRSFPFVWQYGPTGILGRVAYSLMHPPRLWMFYHICFSVSVCVS